MPEDPTPDPIEALREQLANANARLVQSELKTHAVRAGLIDLDCLKLLDISKAKLSEDGALPDGEAILAKMKQDKPWLFAKSAPPQSSSHAASAPKADPAAPANAMKMTHDEWQAARKHLIKGS